MCHLTSLADILWMVHWPQMEPVCLDWTTLWVQMMPRYPSYWSGECITCLLVEGVMRLLPSLGHRALAAFSSVLCCQRQGPWLLPLEAVLPCPARCKTGGWRQGQRAQNMQILYPSLSQSLAGLRGKPLQTLVSCCPSQTLRRCYSYSFCLRGFFSSCEHHPWGAAWRVAGPIWALSFQPPLGAFHQTCKALSGPRGLQKWGYKAPAFPAWEPSKLAEEVMCTQVLITQGGKARHDCCVGCFELLEPVLVLGCVSCRLLFSAWKLHSPLKA